MTVGNPLKAPKNRAFSVHVTIRSYPPIPAEEKIHAHVWVTGSGWCSRVAECLPAIFSSGAIAHEPEPELANCWEIVIFRVLLYDMEVK